MICISDPPVTGSGGLPDLCSVNQKEAGLGPNLEQILCSVYTILEKKSCYFIAGSEKYEGSRTEHVMQMGSDSNVFLGCDVPGTVVGAAYNFSRSFPLDVLFYSQIQVGLRHSQQ